MRKINITSIVFLVMILLCFGFTIATFFSHVEISEKENRNLQRFPQFNGDNYLNGSFFRDLEAYCYDHFPQRERVLELVTVYDRIKGIQPEIMALQKGNAMDVVVSQSKDEKKEIEADQIAEAENKEIEEKKADFTEYKTQTQNLEIMAVKDRLLELYHFQENKIQAYAEALNQFAQNMPEQTRMYSLIVPTQIGLTGEQYQDFSDPQEKAITYIYSLLDKRYQTVEVFQPLYEHREEYLYFRSDHHWTQLGAYYGAQVFAEKAEVDFRPIDDYEKKSFEGFLGYLYQNNQVEKVAQNPDQLDVYLGENRLAEITNYYYTDDSLNSYTQPMIHLSLNEKTPTYGTFLGGDFPVVVYQNPQPKAGRKLMIIKDSYANAFIPWLTGSFDKIVVIDPRFFKENIYDLAIREEITDCLVLDYIMVTGLDGFIECLDNIGTPKK